MISSIVALGNVTSQISKFFVQDRDAVRINRTSAACKTRRRNEKKSIFIAAKRFVIQMSVYVSSNISLQLRIASPSFVHFQSQNFTISFTHSNSHQWVFTPK